MSCLVKNDRQLYQYRNSVKFNSLLNSLFNIVDSTSICELNNFFDVNAASGVWLDQLAGLFNVNRVFSNLTNAFILGLSKLGSTDVLGGAQAPLSDNTLKALFLATILKNNSKTKSINYIYSVFDSIFNITSMSIIEGDMSLTINVQLSTEEETRTLIALVDKNPKWFGCPAGVSVTYNYGFSF